MHARNEQSQALAPSGALPDQRRGGLQGRERRL